MLRCEIENDIINQRVNIYLFDKEQYIKYDDTSYSYAKYDSHDLSHRIKPFLSINYELWDIIKSTVKQKSDTTNEHLEDLRWVLKYFMDKNT